MTTSAGSFPLRLARVARGIPTTAILVILAGTLCAGCDLYDFLFPTARLEREFRQELAARRNGEPPKYVLPPEVKVGDEFLEKTLLMREPAFGTVTDLRYGELDPRPGLELCVVSRSDVVYLGDEGDTFGRLTFTLDDGWREFTRSKCLDVEGDGTCEFLCNKGLLWALLDHSGRTIWTTEQFANGVNSVGYGDVDGDGSLEFVIDDYDRFIVVDSQGHEMWRKPHLRLGPDFETRVVRLEENGEGAILALAFHGERVFFDSSGEFLRRREVRTMDPALVSYPQDDAREVIYILSKPLDSMNQYSRGYALSTLDGDPIAQYEGVPPMMRVITTFVRLAADEEPYFAFSGMHAYQGKKWAGFEKVQSEVCVFDAQQKLVYNEILPDAGLAIGTMPSDRPGQEDLLVGGKGTVWRYSAKTQSPKSDPEPSSHPGSDR